jgi:ABC-type antimicrobial peptide transport system permease subunit
MNAGRLIGRSLRFHARTNAAIVLGVAVGATVLAGALVVGDSMRATLRSLALDRLGAVTHSVSSAHFFRDELAGEVSTNGVKAAAVIVLRGGVANAASDAYAGGVQVIGIAERYWELAHAGQASALGFPEFAGRSILLNQALAEAIGAQRSDDVVVRVGRPQKVSTDLLLGRRDETALSLRLTVAGVLPAEGLAEFSLEVGQRTPFNAFVPRALLQRALGREGLSNTLLISAPDVDADAVEMRLREGLRLEDLDLRLRVDAQRGTAALESGAFLLTRPAIEAANAAAEEVGLRAEPLLTYLANGIAVEDSGKSIPYSTVTAVETSSPSVQRMRLRDGRPAAAPPGGEILLNRWAADELGAAVGQTITLTYFSTGDFGALREEQASFRLVGVVELEGAAADPGFTPEYEGVTDAVTMTAWNPPFPIDLARIRPVDEAYWEKHKATPKAYIALEDGLRLWRTPQAPGELTAVRFTLFAEPEVARRQAETLEKALRERLGPAALGLAVRPVRAEAEQAAQGTTDFGGLFLGFSFFLIASAILLVTLLFRLGIERRSRELGVLRATGYSWRLVALLLLGEALTVAAVGTLLGLVGARAYAWLMLAGLRSWWSGAVGAPRLLLAGSASSYAIGALVTLALTCAVVLWSAARVVRRSPRDLLAGKPPEPAGGAAERGPVIVPLLMVSTVAAICLLALAAGGRIAESSGFFGAGASALVAGITAVAWWLAVPRRFGEEAAGRMSVGRLGARNTSRHRLRSVLTIALLACASFLIVALESFRREPAEVDERRTGPTGGFTLFAESAAPLAYDLNTPEGREQLGLTTPAGEAVDGMRVFPMRLRPGDATSCANLYIPAQPRIVGAPRAFRERGGFRFADVLRQEGQRIENPWLLLGETLPGGAIPAIGDAASVRWQLHRGLGEDLIVRDARGEPVRLRFVALLEGSALQDEIIIGEADFRRLFPNIDGYRFFLIETSDPEQLTAVLERGLRGYGFDVAPIAERLARYRVVQNTYLSTFQTLGGLGLVLGTVGLVAVMLRNIWERRTELALLRALGFSAKSVGGIVLVENAVLVALGLAVGTLAAWIAIFPQLRRTAADLPWISWAMLLFGVLAIGVGVGALAVASAVRQPLLASLRRE